MPARTTSFDPTRATAADTDEPDVGTHSVEPCDDCTTADPIVLRSEANDDKVLTLTFSPSAADKRIPLASENRCGCRPSAG